MPSFQNLIRIVLLLIAPLIIFGCSDQEPAMSAPIPSEASSPQRPNFLLITTDDMGYTDLGAFGGADIPTPNLDRLALEGIRLTNFHVNVSCAPTRSMLMSGTGNHEAGMGSQQAFAAFAGQPGYEQRITDRVVTIPERMQAAGYHTYMAGKWHLGGSAGVVQPGERGFERSFALLPGGWDHYRLPPGSEIPSLGSALDVPYSEDGELLQDLPEDFYSTNAYIDKMIGYLESNVASDQPFFAWLAPTAPHWPLQVLPEWKDRFVGDYDEGYEALCHARQLGAWAAGVLPEGADLSICPEIATPWNELSEDEKALNRRTMELYTAMVAHLDFELGRLLEYLEQSGQMENTYIIYHNDNGPEGSEIFDNRSQMARIDNSLENLGNRNSWVNVGQGWADAQSAPFREEKGSQFEGGIRVPAFILPPNSYETGRISSSFLTVMDVMPTMMELAGIEESSYPQRGQLPIRGKSFASLLENTETVVHAADEAIALDHAGLSFLMEGDWKIMRRVDADNWQLYNTAEDPNELEDLAQQNPQKLNDLVIKYQAHADDIGILRR